MALDNSSNSAAKTEWESHCQKLFNGELLNVITDAGYSEFRAVGPVRVNDAQVTSFVLPQFFTDLDNDGIDDDGNTGYLVIGCARRNDYSTAQVMEVVNTKGIWRLVRSDQRQGAEGSFSPDFSISLIQQAALAVGIILYDVLCLILHHVPTQRLDLPLMCPIQ